MKIVTIVGARPQFVKAAALSRVIKANGNIQEVLVHTGQHFDQNMSQVFFDEMDIPKPDYNLEINSLGHGAMTGKMLEEIEKVLISEMPECVLVYGDTNSTLAGALAAKKLHIPIAHVEAGLRSFNMEMPEEVNRILTDRISDILFCPGDNAIKNLYAEGFKDFDIQISNVGDIMHDTVLHYIKKSPAQPIINGEYALLTLHRQENTDDPEILKSLIEAINNLSEQVKIVFPVHPRTRKRLENCELKLKAQLLDPVGYFEMLNLINHSKLVLTDSGGLQKEAYYLNKFCITLRTETEWVELVENGFNKVCGSDGNKIMDAYSYFEKKSFDGNTNIYGEGNTSDLIVNQLKDFLAQS